ncbi:MAG: galactokinase [Bacteroidota bacterium]
MSIRSLAPGRINIIGEHTDYNEGYVLPAAIDKHTIFELSPNGTPSTVNVTAKNLNESYSFDLESFKPLESGWQNYVMGVVHELQKIGAQIKGFDASFEGDVPIGGGMSSSASLECSLAFGLNELFDLGFSKWEIIKAAQLSEHNFVGIKCGIMDQFSSTMGKKDHVILLDCRSLEFEYAPFDLGEYQLLLLNTNVSHALASSEYNTRRAECGQGVEILRKQFPTVGSLRDADVDMLEAVASDMPDVIYKRCKHVITENARVIEAIEALNKGELGKLGQLVNASHESLSKDYEVSCPELDFLADLASQKDYVLGSRMMGGGFGGCTINIVLKEKVEELITEASKKYFEQFSIELTPYSVGIEDGAHIL